MRSSGSGRGRAEGAGIEEALHFIGGLDDAEAFLGIEVGRLQHRRRCRGGLKMSSSERVRFSVRRREEVAEHGDVARGT